MNICIIRHGETDWNVINKLQGREDIPLNSNGRSQASLCAAALNTKFNNKKWKAIITSPLLRARQTAEIIADVLNIREIYDDERLMERDMGKASGLTEKERKELFPDGNFEGMENWETLRDRVYSAVISGIERFYPEDIIIVSHGGSINSLLAELSNNEIGTRKTRLKNACVSMLSYKGRVLNIEFYNKSHDELPD
jgi:uncharacterized phosphatase